MSPKFSSSLTICGWRKYFLLRFGNFGTCLQSWVAQSVLFIIFRYSNAIAKLKDKIRINRENKNITGYRNFIFSNFYLLTFEWKYCEIRKPGKCALCMFCIYSRGILFHAFIVEQFAIYNLVMADKIWAKILPSCMLCTPFYNLKFVLPFFSVLCWCSHSDDRILFLNYNAQYFGIFIQIYLWLKLHFRISFINNTMK